MVQSGNSTTAEDSSISSRLCNWLISGRASSSSSSSSSFILKCQSFHAQLGLDVPPEMKSLHISLNTAHSECKPSAFISSFTHLYQVFFPLPAHLTPATTTFLQADTQSSSLHMPKPPQSTLPHHLINALYTQKTVQIHTAFPILQRHSAHSSHHHLFCPLQTLQIHFLHRPGLSPICQCNLDTISFPL